MTVFYFNNCHPKCNDKELLSNALHNTLKEYQTLKREFTDEVDGVVSIEIENLQFDTHNFKDVIEFLKEKDIRGYAFQLFNKYPLEQFLDIDNAVNDEDTYEFIVDEDEKLDAFYLKIAFDNSSSLFSLGIHKSVTENQICIKDSTEGSYCLPNLFGQEDNTNFLRNLIQNEINSKQDNFKNLEQFLDSPVTSSKFKKAYNKSSNLLQKEVINSFAQVKKLKDANENVSEVLLKNVTPAAENDIEVFELKIREPQVMRLYFTEHEGKRFLASFEQKPLKDTRTNQQSDHIKSAISMLKQMIKIESLKK